MLAMGDIIKFLLLNISKKSLIERNKTKIAIVGTGASGRSCFFNAERLVKVKYVLSQSLRNDFIYRYCKVEVTDDYEKILRDPEINSIIVCNSNDKHFEFAKKALINGKNVLLEKPICVTLRECDELKIVADAHNARIGGILQYRFLNALNIVKSFIDRGLLGEIIFINGKVLWRREKEYFKYGRGTRDSDGGGVLMKQAIHCLDLMAFLGQGIADAHCLLFNINKDIDIEDTAVASLKYGKGIGVLQTTICNSRNEQFEVEVIGTKGRVLFNQRNRLNIWSPSKKYALWNWRIGIPQNLMYLQIKDFLNAVRYNRPMKVDFLTARQSLENVILLYDRAR